LFTGDDEVRLHRKFHSQDDAEQEKQLALQPRANVLYEAGMAMGRYPGRTVLVEIGRVKLFGDISGLHTVKLNNSIERRQDLALRLRNGGCAVNLDGQDWLKEGNFGPEESATKRSSNRKGGKQAF